MRIYILETVNSCSTGSSEILVNPTRNVNWCRGNGIHPTVSWIIFKMFLNITTEEGIFNDDGNLFQSELPLN